jgi:hypothetical protein
MGTLMTNDRTTKIVIASEHMTDILLNMLKAQAAQNDLQFSKDVAVKLIEKFISLLIYKTLVEESDKAGTHDRKFKNTSSAYKTLKHDIQEAVGLAFGSALHAFSGTDIDYYCKLIPIGEPLNSEMC